MYICEYIIIKKKNEEKAGSIFYDLVEAFIFFIKLGECSNIKSAKLSTIDEKHLKIICSSETQSEEDNDKFKE